MANDNRENYNINILIQAVNDYFCAEQELKMFLETWVPGWWENKTTKQREDYTKYTERDQEKFNTVSMLCQLIKIDMDSLITTVKAMNRYEKLTKWEKCIHVTYLNEKNIKRFLAASDEYGYYYNSTGRKRMYAE